MEKGKGKSSVFISWVSWVPFRLFFVLFCKARLLEESELLLEPIKGHLISVAHIKDLDSKTEKNEEMKKKKKEKKRKKKRKKEEE